MDTDTSSPPDSLELPLLASQRRELILAEVERTGAARVTDLTARLGVSDMTIRRDIAALAGQGLVTRVHGGAVAPRRVGFEPGFAAKSSVRTEAKAAVGRAAAALIRPGDCVAISAGTTTFAVARALAGIRGLTVVTNSIPVAEHLAAAGTEGTGASTSAAGGPLDPDGAPTVILTGGVRTPSAALVGPVAIASLKGLHTDWLFLGVHGLDASAGLTTPNLLEADTSRALIACASHVVVTADSSKWGVVALATIAPLSAVDILITDDGLPADARAALAEQVGETKLVTP